MSEKTFIPLTNEAAVNLKTVKISHFLTTTALLGAVLLPTSAKAAEDKPKELPTVTVIDSKSNGGYKANESGNSKLTGPLLNTPRTVSVVTRQLMDDQGVTKVSDALRNVPGISLAAGEAGAQGDNLTIRGFSARNDFFVDGMRDYGSYFRDAFNLESVEVVQGPGSVVFGRGSTGGVIQQNSKHAFLGSKKDGTLMFGTNDTARATVDVNSQIDGIKGSAIRINAMANTNKVAERDYAKYRRTAFAPTMAFGLGTDTRLNLSYYHQEENNTPDYGVPFYKGQPVNVDRSNFYGFKSNDHIDTNVDISTMKFEHDISDNLMFRDQARYARYYRDIQVTEPQMTVSPTTVTRSLKIRKSLETYLGNQADLTSKFSTFGAKHTAVTGFSMESESSAPTVFGSANTTTNAQNPTNDGFSGIITTTSATKVKIDTLALYALDTIKLGDKWEISLAGRLDNMRTNYDQLTLATNSRLILSQTNNLVSYSGGVVYKPASNGSVYFNHGTSFNPSAESFALSVSSSKIAPEKNTIYELGTKWDLFQKRLATSVAIFRADKDNARETDGLGNNILSGSQRVYGFLAQANGSITENWKLAAGYSYMDGKVTHSLVNATYKNRNLQNVPEHSFNIFTTYNFKSKLQIGGGANFMTERFASQTTTDVSSGTYRNVPSYLIFNFMAKYPVSKNLSLQLNVNNLTNKYYYDQLRGSQAVVPGEGRVFLLTSSFKF